MTVTIASFLVLLALITLAGAASIIRKNKSTGDYLVANREVPPWLSALSTVATNNSGFMFIGMIAYTYRLGLESVWMMVGWIVGDLVAWSFVHPRVRRSSQRNDKRSLPSMLARSGGCGERGERAVVILAGLITLFFLGVYAAAQLKAGSTALHALFGWEAWVGVVIGAIIVIIYSYAGGIRADIWTDAAQSFVMIGTMVMILLAGVSEVGGWQPLLANLENQDPDLVRWTPDSLAFGLPPFVAGFAFGGFTATGQPHLMTRIMALDERSSIARTGLYYFGWYIPFFLASVGVGLYCRAVIPDLTALPTAQALDQPTELALPLITMRLLPDIFVGVALAGLFAATVSTADSQIIVCSGAVTQDIKPAWKDSYLATKVATLSITAFALIVALFAPEGVFGLVLIAWSALGASLTPVLIVRLFRLPLPATTAMIMMTVGIAVVIAWHLSSLDDDVFKALPGVLAAAIVYATDRLLALRRGHRPRVA